MDKQLEQPEDHLVRNGEMVNALLRAKSSR